MSKSSVGCESAVKRPYVGTLERRIVLNATAELTGAGELLISGDAADDYVLFETVNSGSAVQLRDSGGTIIPITGHTGGATGNETDPLDITDITSGRTEIDMGGGADSFDLQLPNGLDIEFIGGAGDDRINLDTTQATAPSAANTLSLESETIDLNASGPTVQLGHRDVQLVGNVTVGGLGGPGPSVVDIGTGSLRIQGSVELGGSVRVDGQDASFDSSAATVSATSSGTDILFNLTSGASLQLGAFDDSFGFKLDDLQVSSSSTVELQGEVNLAGGLSIDADASTRLLEDIDAESVTVDSSTIRLGSSNLVTDGGDVLFDGDVSLAGDFEVDTSDAGASFSGGDFRVTGVLESEPAAGGSLTVETLGMNAGGAVRFDGRIGDTPPGAADLSSLDVAADSIAALNIGIDGGLLRLHAEEINVFGAVVRSSDSPGTGSGTIDIAGNVTFHAASTDLQASEGIQAIGSVATQSSTSNLAITSGGSIDIASAVSGGNQLFITSATTTSVGGNVSNWNHASISAGDRFQFSGSHFSVSDSVVLDAATTIDSGATLQSATLRLEGEVDVTTHFVIDSELVDSVSQTAHEKYGAGTLVLEQTNDTTTEFHVYEGTLQVDGEIGNRSRVQILSDATLAGSGQVLSEVDVIGGAIAPSSPHPQASPGELQLSDVRFDRDSVFRVDIQGDIPGSTLDSIALADGTMDLAFAELELSVASEIDPDTEMLIIQNRTSNPVAGQLRASFDENGQPLASPRTLNEGAKVLEAFGPGNRSVSAFITYLGGDGNDVAIVTSGDHIEAPADATFLHRVGSNIHFHQGATLADAMQASPTIRPLAGLNQHLITVQGASTGSQMIIDIDQFVDPSADSLHFDADILFDAKTAGGQGRVVFEDSDTASNDSPEAFRLTYSAGDEITLAFDHDPSNAVDFLVSSVGVQSIDLPFESTVFDAALTPGNDTIEIKDASNPETLSLDVTAGLASSSVRFGNPSAVLNLSGEGGDDAITVASLDSSFSATGRLQGGLGQDVLNWFTNAELGEPSGTVLLEFNSDTVNIDADLKLLGSTGINIDAEMELNVSGSLDTESGLIRVRSDAATTDLSNSVIRSGGANDAIQILGGDFLLGDVDAANGVVVLGDRVSQADVGAVAQASDAAIVASELFADASGTLALTSSTNQIGEVQLRSEQSVSIQNDQQHFAAEIHAAGPVLVRAAGDVSLAAIDSDSTIEIQSVGTLQTALAATSPTVRGTSVELATGVPYSGRTLNTESPQAIGDASQPVTVAASESFAASTRSTNGDLFISASSHGAASNPDLALLIDRVDAGSGTVSISGRVLADATSDSDVDLIGSEINLTAEEGIGHSARLTVGNAEVVRGTTTIGSIALELLPDSVITLDQLTSGGGIDTEISILHSSDEQLVLNSIDNLAADIHIESDTSITLASSGHLRSAGGEIAIIAGDTPSNPAMIDMVDGSVVDAGNGHVTIAASGDLRVSSIVSSRSGDAILLESSSGTVLDAGDRDLDIVANSGAVQIVSHSGIGSGDAIETDVQRLEALVSDSGNIDLDDASAIELVDVMTTDGAISISSADTVLATSVRSQNRSQLDGSDHHDIQLESRNATADIRVALIDAMHGADVALLSGDDVVAADTTNLVRADDLRIVALNATDDASVAVDLKTDVNDLDVSVDGIARGDIVIEDKNSIRLASSDSNTDTEQISTHNGTIQITASAVVEIVDAGVISDGAELTNDLEIRAGGQNGHVDIRAGLSIAATDGVQIFAAQSAPASVRLEADSFVLGNHFQIATGEADAVARFFAPRPATAANSAAFFDPSSVLTTTLQRTAATGSEGVLSIDVGGEGERGLALLVDWGTETDRFQLVDGISGDAAPLSLSHVYPDQELFFSRLGGRSSSTDPIEVRFAVSHHESILLLGDSIQRTGAPLEMVEGRLLSSTDNPQTQESDFVPDLEGGKAQFLIPSLTLPTELLTPRIVIPEIVPAPITSIAPLEFSIPSGNIAQIDPIVSPPDLREEYFLLRVISPSPDGEDLMAAVRLPDDIIAGDRLREFFRSLPDGRYELQYVMGDGNVRSLLDVELRDGKPIRPIEDIDGGPLRLIPIEETSDGVNESPDDAPPPPPDDDEPASTSRIDTTGTNGFADSVHQRPFSAAGRFRARLQQLGDELPAEPKAPSPAT